MSEKTEPTPYRTVRADEIREGDTIVNYGEVLQAINGTYLISFLIDSKADRFTPRGCTRYNNEAVVIIPKA